MAFFNISTFIFYEELFPFLGNICLNNIAALIFKNKYVILKPWQAIKRKHWTILWKHNFKKTMFNILLFQTFFFPSFFCPRPLQFWDDWLIRTFSPFFIFEFQFSNKIVVFFILNLLLIQKFPCKVKYVLYFKKKWTSICFLDYKFLLIQIKGIL